MKIFQHDVEGEQVSINVVEHEEDLDGFREFVARNIRCLAVDTETTGLDIYSDKFRCRLVQFGTGTEAWVVPVESGELFAEAVRLALASVSKLVLHNASFDLQVLDRTLGVPMDSLWPKVYDTKILAHLIDPRGQRDEGGIGHSLENLTRYYIDADVASDVKTLMADLAKVHHTTKANVWKKVPINDPQYLLYAGMDPVLAARLLKKLLPLIPASSETLVPYEHSLARVCSMIEQTGFLLDVDYSRELSSELKYRESINNEIALKYGCDNVNSTDAVADVLETLGVTIKGRTPSGKRQVNDDLLAELAGPHDDSEVAQFAYAVIAAKKAGKWRKTWVENFLAQADSGNRCHASINPLQARTARMSITGIPAQTLPAGDSTVRRCFLADPGHLIASVDYQSQELRVLAALSGDRTMISAFKRNADLHQITADAAGVSRKVGKATNFTTVYGGGPAKVAETAGISFPEAKRAVDAFAETYPGVAALSQRLQREAAGNGSITTPSGRRLPVDPTRAYSSLNYLVQSTARDVTGRALLRLHDAGFTPYIRLPIHDEILASVPEQMAVWGAEEIGRIMAEDMEGVHIGTEAEVGQRSWGSLYGADI
jgi:DNA polymerase-1